MDWLYLDSCAIESLTFFKLALAFASVDVLDSFL